ncbi:MAG: PAS domain S-box protein [Nitrospira sp.]|nr:PAS domain S-box protein [Nitrospira sp.]
MKDKNQIKEISQIYEAFFDNANDGILIADIENKYFHVSNKMICQMLDYSTEEIKNIGVMNIHPNEDLPYVIEQFEKLLKKELVMAVNIPVKRKDGSIFYADINSFPITLSGKTYLVGVFRDVTDRKRGEEALKEREKELEIKTKNLEEMNAALNVLLKKREEDKAELEEKVLLNIKQLIEPYVLKLKQSGLDERQKTLAAILESNLKDITSSFAYSLSSRHLNLTPGEVKVANLVKQDKTSKEICEILGSSEKVVAFHRQNIRRKLGLQNKKVNLKSCLIAKA